MLGKKGVTEIILVIGAVVITAIIITLGVARFVMPLIKTAPAYTVLDAQLTIDTVYAAPDDMLTKFRIDYPKGWTRTVVWITDGKKFAEGYDCEDDNPKISGAWSRSSYGFQGAGYSSEDECDNKWVSDTSQMQIIKMEKTYDNTKRTSKMKIGKW